MTDIHHDAARTLLASLPAGATPGRYRSSPGFMSETIVRCREPHEDITVGAQVVGYCEHADTRALLAAAPALRDALRATLEEVGRLRDEVNQLRTGREAARSYADRVGEIERLRDERAAVVAWLREVAATSRDWSEHTGVYDGLADAIERGEHRREEGA
jgi:hypothetical protein